jgi:predicted ATPase/signal transduction histidine kinase
MTVTLSGYRIGQAIYTGTRTLVYRGQRESDNQPVVIKFLGNEYPHFSELLQFRNQYTIAKNLNIPGIIRPDSLEPCGNSYALVMADIGGISLLEYSQIHPLELTDVLVISLQLADILHDLHQNRVIHKDIKPANILIHPDTKQVKLIDFSIASLLPKETQEIKNPNGLEGTLAYLAPEQTGRMNRGIDYRSDFYALGVTLFELFAGQLPFESNDPMELVHCHIAKQPPTLTQFNIPEAIANIATKLMAKNAESRYQSALGFKYDLEICLNQLKETGTIEPFEIGTRDICDRFTIPEKLYGRQAEVNTLLAAFDRVADGASELMLVAGFSGIGKTAVVNEVHKPIVRQRGYFIKGKFDQFNRNIPLSAFVQALRDLMGQLLSESDAQLQTWKAKILSAVGDNGQVLIEVIPELELIIGQQPIATELSGSASQNRFNLLFQKFIEVFTTAEHPLVIFLDDLQWADLASLQLLKLLMNDNGYLLMLGAYRDNEVSPIHPFILTVEEIKKANAIVNTITLAPLAFEDTNHLVADTLNCSRELAKPLTELIDRKTQGNPFFTTQFLKALHDDGHIRFDRDRRYWECNIAQVNALVLTDDVVEFMAVQLQKLSPETQQVLKLAACVGNQFDLNTLAIVSEQSPTEAATALWKALQEGLILPTSQIYKFFQGTEKSDTQNTVNPKYRFLHDRIQQAAYSLIPDEIKKASHLKIGQILLKNCSEKEREEKIFEIVNNLKQGIELLDNLSQRQELARLNLQAGQKAKQSIAYSEAASYFQTGITLLKTQDWEAEYDTNLALYSELAETQYLSGDLDSVDTTSAIVLKHTRSLTDAILVYCTQISSYQAQGKLLKGFELGLQVLDELGVRIPRNITAENTAENLSQTLNKFQSKSIEELVELPRSSDRNLPAIQEILTLIIGCAYKAYPEFLPFIICEQVNLIIERGNLPLSASIYALYGMLLCGSQDFEVGHRAGEVALSLMERFPEKQFETKVLNLIFAYINPWKNRLKDSLPHLKKGFTVGLETGDLEYASYAINHYCIFLYFSGTSLETNDEEMAVYIEAMKRLKQVSVLNVIQILHQASLNLKSKSNEYSLLDGESCQEKEMIVQLKGESNYYCLAILYVNKLILSYLFSEASQTIELASIASEYVEKILGDFCNSYLYFYRALSYLAIREEELPTLQSEERTQIVAADLAKLKKLAHYAPMNFRHKLNLIEAEQFRVADKKSEAIELYDQAIAGAKTNGYIQEEALANELAAKFYLNWGKEKIAQTYMQEAYYCYARWGAKAKTDDLEKRYPQLLQPILQQRRLNLNPLETIATIARTSISTSTHSSSSSISDALDFASILKAAQAISSSIELDELMASLTRILLENSGAKKAALILLQNETWQVRAITSVNYQANSEVGIQTVLDSQPLDTCQNVPRPLINYVKNTQKTVIIDRLQTEIPGLIGQYMLAHQPQSVLCTPIVDRGNLVGILYLENQLTGGVFTSERLQIINLLSSQAAISLENARLYQQSQQALQDLQQAQLQIVQSEKMSALGNLVAGVAHEINNPVGFISGNINEAIASFADLRDYLQLYQEKFPDPGPEITEKAEELDIEYLLADFPKMLNSIEVGCDRIKGISTSLRTFSRADKDYKVPFNIHEGIDSTLLILKHRLKANEKRPAIEIVTEYGYVPPVECFPGQLNQVFMNILANAIDALDESNAGRKFDEIQANPNRITIQTSVADNQVKITIADNGMGMSEEIKQKIFDHLFTTKGVGKGTGLGMAIARQIIIEKHGGAIEVDSQVDQGTIFTILLPIEA